MKNKISIGVLGTSDISYRKTIPAILESINFHYIGLALASKDERNFSDYEASNSKAIQFQKKYGGKIYLSYQDMIKDASVEAIYIPLPPALHYRWGREALAYEKHILMEKPFTTNYLETSEIVRLAKDKRLAVHENYAFLYHKQFQKIQSIIDGGHIGKVRHVRTVFSYPERHENDFRHSKELGGGALLDCGGYPLLITRKILGESIRIEFSALGNMKGYNVDIFGHASLINDHGTTAQIYFGMMNSYMCELEVIGNQGTIKADRIFTAPEDMQLYVTMSGTNNESILIEPHNQFLSSINFFHKSIFDEGERSVQYREILGQSRLLEELRDVAVNYLVR